MTKDKLIEKLKDYPYLYETHLHTNLGSACANNSGSEMAEALWKYGYAGMFVTEHNWGGNTCVPRAIPWEDGIDLLKRGYEEALEFGKKHDFDVIWGYEAGYGGPEFLIYGISPEWLKAHPEMKDATIEDQYKMVSEAGGMVVQAHPFREAWYIDEVRVFPDFVDAVEGVNATHSCSKSQNHNKPVYDERAIAFANEKHLPMTAGSDIHSTNLFGGGIAFKHRIHSAEEYKKAIMVGDYVLTNGEVVYDHLGQLLYSLN